MTDTFLNFSHMSGYGLYVWSAYGSVLGCLVIQWFIPWRRWRKYLRTQQNHHE